jgi:hypothetical protein
MKMRGRFPSCLWVIYQLPTGIYQLKTAVCGDDFIVKYPLVLLPDIGLALSKLESLPSRLSKTHTTDAETK